MHLVIFSNSWPFKLKNFFPDEPKSALVVFSTFSLPIHQVMPEINTLKLSFA